MDITQDTRYWKAFIEQRLNDFDRQRILNLLANDANYADAFRAFEIEYNLAKRQWAQEFSTSEPETQPDTIPSNHLLKWAAPLGATVVLLTAGVGVWNHYHPELPTPTPTREIPATNSIPDSTLGDKAYAQSDRDTGQTGSDAHSKEPSTSPDKKNQGQSAIKKQTPKDSLKRYQAQLLAGLIRDEKLKSNGLGNVPKGLSFDKQLQELYQQKAYKDIIQQTDTLPAADRSLSNFMRALALYQLGGQTNLKEALDIFQYLGNDSDYKIHARWNRLLLMAALDQDSETVCSLWAEIRNSTFYKDKNASGYAEKLDNLKIYLKSKGYTCFE